LSDPRSSWVYREPQWVQDTALLVHAFLGRLPTLMEMGSLTRLFSDSLTLAALAHEHFVRQAGLLEQGPQVHMRAVINQVWGAGSATDALVDMGVTQLQAGVSWAQIWLVLARDTHAKARLPADPLGRTQLVQNDHLNETGWSDQAGNNQLFGGAGNDVLIGGSGHNTLDGGTGTDMVILTGTAADYELAYQGDQVLLRHTPTGALNTLHDVEWVQVGGTAYALQAPPSPTSANPGAAPSFGPVAPHIQLLGQAALNAGGFHPDWLV
jgi:hypothetical protein